ncbi:MAG: Protein containing Cadherin domain protein, partial [Halothiobacillaceae bacterium]
PVLPNNSTNSGNTLAWFPAIISGSVYTDEGVTTIADGVTIRLLVNGVSRGSAVTTAGAYSITPSVTLGAGDAILAFIENNTTNGTVVTVANGIDISNFNIYGTHIITRHDNAGSLSNANMATAKGAYVDTFSDINYSVSSGNLTVINNHELYIPTSHSYTPGGNVTTPALESLGTFNGGANTIDSNGTLVVSGGSFTATSGTTYIGSHFTISAGTFTHNSGTITLDSSNRTLDTGTAVLNNLIFFSGDFSTINGTVDIDGDLTITAAFSLSAGTGAGVLAVAGNVTTTDSAVSGTAKIRFDGNGAQTLQVNGDGAGGTGALPGVEINKPGGTLTLKDTIQLDGTSGWIWTAGSVVAYSTADADESAVEISNDLTIDSGTMTFNNLRFSAGDFYTINGTVDIDGDLTITSAFSFPVATGAGVLAVAGDVTTTDTTVSGTTAITLNGTGAQSINTSGTGDLPNGTLTINKASGTATLAANLTLNSAGQDLTITSGTLDLAGYNLTLTGAGDVLTVN